MIIGIDVGGTHTDGVLIKNGQVTKTGKVVTRRDDLKESILEVLDELLVGQDEKKIERIVFSTTLTTNLIAQRKYPPTGLVLIPGPGMKPDWLKLGTINWLLKGSIDHRGRKVMDLEQNELKSFLEELATSGIVDLAIVGKFSTRNPSLEEKLESFIREHLPEVDNVQLGSRVAPVLNFPRRVHTTWLNTAVYRENTIFLKEVQDAVHKRGINAQLYLLKADGGTMLLQEGINFGVETIKSGPAASIMGFLALSGTEKRTSLLLDVGGTTTDIALITGGVPLFEPEGVEIEGYLTSVRGLLNRSIPYGGDSRIIVDNGQIGLAPERVGPAVAFGGSVPTLTDALVVAGLVEKGDQKQARLAFAKLVEHIEDSLEEAAQKIIDHFYLKVKEAVEELLIELNNRPVYTIHELLTDTRLEPEVVMMIGGPAKALLPGLADKLGLAPILPDYYHVANALGAAVARPTLRQTLYADTAQKFYRLSGIMGKQQITGRFTLKDARQILLEHMKSMVKQNGGLNIDDKLIEITHEESFNLVRGFSTQGQILRLKAQVKPGIDPALGELKFLMKGEIKQ
ncbi:hypothetical protein BBF96_06025 [Anoxybacter fermentans]|uniref:Hydantoinase n=1 Tax=Anoxybacter fermentans TaxID=1323375 RepID=A0A3S9SXK8_9FIRM|nr:hydantoinase/oxoprolinase family protein [Anoxybacter fermentans]AZR72990.1 hypothetical protein BBF96_06025 [Anoxybacter fermentans]